MSEKKKTPGSEFLYEPKSVWDRVTEAEKKEIFTTGEDYKAFLSAAKTERLAVKEIVRRAAAAGFVDINGAKNPTKWHMVYRKKSAVLVVMGKDDPAKGINLIVSHIDSPRLDLKQRPLYEDVEIAHFKTHYYGGLKKYHWVSRPLALYGVVVTADGREVEISIGDGPEDPVFTVADLLIHLAGKAQMDKKISEAIQGEKLNLVCGSIPVEDTEAKERVKLAVLRRLHDDYGIVEEDLISAELEAVPAGPARDVGLDRSMVGAYGQDDRASGFAALAAALSQPQPQKTCVLFFLDKEEIGSDGVTGARGRIIEEVAEAILEVHKGTMPGAGEVSRMLSRSRCLSADVNGALDPDWQEVHEKTNAARLGYGLCVTKFTGSRGKYMASDASAELVGWVRRLFNENGIVWQYGELGKVDEGGGGTIAKDIAERGIEVIDVGPALLDMHSPFEISSKADIYMTVKGFRAFLQSV
jgi:aspartyl aminopeptidase